MAPILSRTETEAEKKRETGRLEREIHSLRAPAEPGQLPEGVRGSEEGAGAQPQAEGAAIRTHRCEFFYMEIESCTCAIVDKSQNLLWICPKFVFRSYMYIARIYICTKICIAFLCRLYHNFTCVFPLPHILLWNSSCSRPRLYTALFKLKLITDTISVIKQPWPCKCICMCSFSFHTEALTQNLKLWKGHKL